jgi:hypothetical protein
MDSLMKRFGVVLSVWAMGLAGMLGGLAPASASAQIPSLPAAVAVSTPGGFTSLAPSRLLNTLAGVGAPKVAVAAGRTVHLQVTGRGGVPISGVSAVVLNVAVVAPTSAGYITVFGAGTNRPTASNLNFVKGQTVPNLVIAPVGAGGVVDLYNGSNGTVQLVADVSGYFLAGTPEVAGAFGSLPPSRLLNTLAGVGAPKVAVAAGGTVRLQVTGRGGVPATGLSAVVLNVAVVAPTSAGYITVYGDGTNRPTASNLNFVKGQTVPNLVIAPVGAGGLVDLYNGSTGTVQLVADVSGYFLSGTPTEPGALGSLAPSRLLNTLAGVGAPKVAVAAGGTVHLQVTGRGGVPATGVSAAVLNVAVLAPTSAGYITVYGAGTPRPGASNLNFVKGQTVPNLVIAPVGAGGVVDLYNGSTGTVQLVADVSGGFMGTAANTPPGPVTALTATTTSTSVSLSWVNPADADFAGVMIRRAQGATPPASATAGDLVTDVDKPATSFTNSGLTPLTQYSYALFAHDATPLYASRAVISPTTTAAMGGISGFVTDAGGTQQGLANVTVNVSSYSLSDVGSALTGADGSYTVSGVPAGTGYQVCFSASGATGGSSAEFGYVTQCYDNQPTWATATPVAVTAGGTKTGINAALHGGGAVSGTVTDAGGSLHGLENVQVNAFSPSTQANGSAQTDAAGNYTVPGLPAGNDYQVCFFTWSGATGGSSDATGYIEQCYDNQTTSGTPTPVTVILGEATAINAALAGAAAISGTVTDAGGAHHVLANVWVEVYSPSRDNGWGTETDADGRYTLTGLPAGTDYRVCFTASGARGGSSDALGYLEQCYNGQPTSNEATPVSVTIGENTSGIDAALAGATAIEGKVTDAGGTHRGLGEVWVNVSSVSTGAGGGAITAADGSYSVTGLPAGTDYQVCFDASGATGGSSMTGYIDRCYNNQPMETPTPVTATLGTATTGINAALAGAGALSGTVTDAGGSQGLATVYVDVISSSTGSGGGAITAADGSYTVAGLPAGTDYQVCFSGSGATGGSSAATGYVDECYDNQPTSGTPTPVAVTTGATRTGTNAALAGAGALSGTVTDAGGTHHGLANVAVAVFSPSTDAGWGATTAADGSYTVTGLPAGTDYQVCFYTWSGATGGSSDATGYVEQCYDNQPTSDTPTPVSVTPGVRTTDIDASLVGNP